MSIERLAKDTLTAVEMDVGEELLFTLACGEVRKLKLIHIDAAVTESTKEPPKTEKAGAVTNYRFLARFEIDGAVYNLVRYVSTAKSFYEPWRIMGLHIWLDAVDKIFDFLTETHGECKPKKQCRFAIQDAGLRICPVLLHPWCPLPPGRLRFDEAYHGEDVWMGAFPGGSAHGGLDINHPSGTPIWTPFAIDRHELFNSLEKGDNNNRWRGVHRWPNGAEWVIQVHHLSRLYVPEHEPIAAGALLADGGGVRVSRREHSHFVFRVRDGSDEVLLDPWILFWQMYRDREVTSER